MRDYQDRVRRHVALVTEGDPTDVAERRDRFSEESLEAAQAFGQTRAEAHALVDYVHDRPVGEPRAEIGGVLYTVMALADEAGIDADACAEAELARLDRPEMVEKIRRKRAGRHGRGPLPGADGAAPARDVARDAFARGAAARAAGLGTGANPVGAEPGRGAWQAGFSACAGIGA